MGRLWASWRRLGIVLEASWSRLVPSWGRLEPSWGRLAASWAVLGRFGCRLGAVLGRLGGVLGPLGGQDPTRARAMRDLRPQVTRLGLIFGRFLDVFWDHFLSLSYLILKGINMS